MADGEADPRSPAEVKPFAVQQSGVVKLGAAKPFGASVSDEKALLSALTDMCKTFGFSGSKVSRMTEEEAKQAAQYIITSMKKDHPNLTGDRLAELHTDLLKFQAEKLNPLLESKGVAISKGNKERSPEEIEFYEKTIFPLMAEKIKGMGLQSDAIDPITVQLIDKTFRAALGKNISAPADISEAGFLKPGYTPPGAGKSTSPEKSR